jgi:heat shock protein HslJ
MRTRGIALLAGLALLISACSAGPGTGGELQGTDWVLRSYQQDGELTLVPDGSYADATFDTQRVSGFGGCNNFNALYRSGGRTLFVSQPATTLMACPDEQMTLEQTYLGLLQQSRFYSAHILTLTIYGAGGETLLVFDAAPRNPLRGAWQVTDYQTAPGSVSAVLPGTQLDVTFGLTSVGGFAGL